MDFLQIAERWNHYIYVMWQGINPVSKIWISVVISDLVMFYFRSNLYFPRNFETKILQFTERWNYIICRLQHRIDQLGFEPVLRSVTMFSSILLLGRICSLLEIVQMDYRQSVKALTSKSWYVLWYNTLTLWIGWKRLEKMQWKHVQAWDGSSATSV